MNHGLDALPYLMHNRTGGKSQMMWRAMDALLEAGKKVGYARADGYWTIQRHKRNGVTLDVWTKCGSDR